MKLTYYSDEGKGQQGKVVNIYYKYKIGIYPHLFQLQKSILTTPERHFHCKYRYMETEWRKSF